MEGAPETLEGRQYGEGASALLATCCVGHVAVVDELLTAGADVDSCDVRPVVISTSCMRTHV